MSLLEQDPAKDTIRVCQYGSPQRLQMPGFLGAAGIRKVLEKRDRMELRVPPLDEKADEGAERGSGQVHRPASTEQGTAEMSQVVSLACPQQCGTLGQLQGAQLWHFPETRYRVPDRVTKALFRTATPTPGNNGGRTLAWHGGPLPSFILSLLGV